MAGCVPGVASGAVPAPVAMTVAGPRAEAPGDVQLLLVEVLVAPPEVPVDPVVDPEVAEPALLAGALLPLGAASPADVLLSLLALSLLVLLVPEPESVL